MNAAMEQAQLSDDAQANRLLVEINRQIVARDMIRDRIQQLERKIAWRERRIRELSLKRTEALNFTLPL